jgi:23S rRNA (uracil1939-C5)-methyltransferase
VVAVSECPVLEPPLEVELHEVARQKLETGAEVDLRVDMQPIALSGRKYSVSDDSFFQVNTGMAEFLVEEVLRGLAPRADKAVVDLYSGVGLFTKAIAEQAALVVGVESNPAAVVDARRNLAGLDNVELMQATVEQAVRSPAIQQQAWDAIVLDPPRRGVEREALSRIATLGAARVVYVSCDPATLARDVAILAQAGYRLDYAQPIDMFPQTAHVETVALLTRNPACFIDAIAP